MKERPILFSAPMVRAILGGRKTQTRRAVKPKLIAAARGFMMEGEEPDWCPYGKPGDRLWVRETWFPCPVGKFCPNPTPIPKSLPDGWTVLFAADGDSVSKPLRWKPPIHMPRWASRITLEVVNVQVERLQSITVEDSLAEGIEHRTMNHPRVEYQWLWESINGGGSWDLNPWVWVIEFRRIPHHAH